MKKSNVLFLLLFLGMGLAQTPTDMDWQSKIDEATYACDTSPAVVLANGTESFTTEAIQLLTRQLSPYLNFEGETPHEPAIVASRTLAAYRKQFHEDRGDKLSFWDGSQVRFLISGTDPEGQAISYLGWRISMISPGTPFSNGQLLGFNQNHLWFEHQDGTLEQLPTGMPQAEAKTTAHGLRLIADRTPDQYLLGALTREMGYGCTIMGKPREISGQITAPTLKLLFFTLLEKEGYEVLQKGQGFTIVRPDSEGMVDMESAIRKVQVIERGGYVSYANPNKVDKAPSEPDPVGDNPRNYTVPSSHSSSSMVSLANGEEVAKILLKHSLAKAPGEDVDEKFLTETFHARLLQLCFHKPGLRDRVLESLPKAYRTLIQGEGNPVHRARQERLLQLLGRSSK